MNSYVGKIKFIYKFYAVSLLKSSFKLIEEKIKKNKRKNLINLEHTS